MKINMKSGKQLAVALALAVGVTGAVATFASGPEKKNPYGGELQVITRVDPPFGSRQPTRPLANVSGEYTCTYRTSPSGPTRQERGKFKTASNGQSNVKVHAGSCVVTVQVPAGYLLSSKGADSQQVKVAANQTTRVAFGFRAGVTPSSTSSPRVL